MAEKSEGSAMSAQAQNRGSPIPLAHQGKPTYPHTWIRVTATTQPGWKPPFWMCSKCGRRTEDRSREDGCDQEK